MKSGRGTPDFEKMVRHSLDVMGTIDRNGFIEYVNEACKQVIGYDSEELIGRHYLEFLHPDDSHTTAQAVQETLLSGKKGNFDNRYVHKNGHAVTIRWSGFWSEQDGVIFCMGRDITEQEEKNARLEESEQRYRTLFDNSPDIIFVENKQGLITAVNQQFQKTFGISEKGAIGASAFSFLTPQMATVNERNLHQVLLGSSRRFDLEVELNGEKRIFDAEKHPIIINNEITGAQTVARNITPMLRSNETIKRQAERLSTIFESITNAFITLDKDWNFTYINREAERLLSLDRQYHVGQNVWQKLPAEIDGVFYQQYHQAVASGKAVHFEAYYAGTNIWVEVNAFPSEEGISIYFNDITEKIKARQELEKLSLVASRTNNGVIIADKDWKIEWVNEGFTKLMGYSLQEAVGKRPSELLHNHRTDRTAFESMQEKLLNGEPISFEAINKKKSGEEVWVSIDITAVLDEQGEVSRFIEVQTDITALKEKERELTQLSRDLYRQNKDLQQFTYIVSHNFRAPVANILGLTDLMTQFDKDTEVYDKSLVNLKESVIRLDTVLRDMNTILSIRDSRQSMEWEQVNLKRKLQQALTSLQEPMMKCGGKVIVDMDESLYVRGKKAYVYGIFHNLLSNAIRYRSEERGLVVHIKCFECPERGIVLSFADNGSGFDMRKANDKVFKLYKRFHRDRKGRGIGLYLVKTYMEAMNGHVEVNSQVGVGTEFRIHLPSN